MPSTSLEDITREAHAQRELQRAQNRDVARAMARRRDAAQKSREILLELVVQDCVEEILRYLLAESRAGDELLYFSQRKQGRFGRQRVVTDFSRQYACWKLDQISLLLRSDGQFAEANSRTIARLWPIESYRDSCHVLGGLERTFKTATRTVLARTITAEGFDDQLCRDVFGVSKEQMMFRLAPPKAASQLLKRPKQLKWPKKRRGKKKGRR